jgi:hypothetical protein
MSPTIDDEIRDLLHRQAATMQPDTAAAEQAIEDRLLAGERAAGPHVIPIDGGRRRPRWVPLAAAAAVLALVVTAGALLAGGDRSEVDTTPADSTPTVPDGGVLPTPLQPGVDLLYTAEGTPEEVAAGYLDDRLDGLANVDVGPTIAEGDLVIVAWRTFEQPEPTAPRRTMYEGTIVLHPAQATDGEDDAGGSTWHVADASTQGLVWEYSRDGRRIQGTVTSSGADEVVVRLVDDTGAELERPRLDGDACTGCERRFEVDVPDGVVDLRIQHVGGTWLSITEMRVGGSATEPDPSGDLMASADQAARAFVEEQLGDEIVNSSGSIDEPWGKRATVVVETGSGATLEVHLQGGSGVRWIIVEVLSGISVYEEGGGIVVTSPAGGELVATLLDGPSDPRQTLPAVQVEAETPVRIDAVESAWLRIDVATDDGPVLRYLARR